MKFVFTLFVIGLGLFGCMAFAQIQVVEGPNTFKAVFAVLPGWAQTFLYQMVFIMGLARLFAKPVFQAYISYVESTPGKEDDQRLAKWMNSWWYKVVAFLFDYLLSVKLKKPQPKKKNEQA